MWLKWHELGGSSELEHTFDVIIVEHLGWDVQSLSSWYAHVKSKLLVALRVSSTGMLLRS